MSSSLQPSDGSRQERSGCRLAQPELSRDRSPKVGSTAAKRLTTTRTSVASPWHEPRIDHEAARLGSRLQPRSPRSERLSGHHSGRDLTGSRVGVGVGVRRHTGHPVPPRTRFLTVASHSWPAAHRHRQRSWLPALSCAALRPGCVRFSSSCPATSGCRSARAEPGNGVDRAAAVR